MSRLFRRAWALEVGPPGASGQRHAGLDMQFAASFDASKPATCDLTVFMPPRAVVNALYDRRVVVRVLAGYLEAGPVEVFAGEPIAGSVSDRLSDRDPSVACQLSAVRGYAGRGTVSRSWGSRGVLASEVIDYLRREMGLAAGAIDLPRDIQYARGHEVSGAPLAELATLVRDCGAEYSVESGRLRVWPRGSAVPRLGDLWAPESGLLEVVGPAGGGERGEVRASALLRPALRPGDRIVIRSPRWSGEVALRSVRHQGQTDGDSWETSIVGVPA